MEFEPLIETNHPRPAQEIRLSRCERTGYHHLSEANFWVLTSTIHNHVARFRDSIPSFLYRLLGPSETFITLVVESSFVGVVSLRFAKDYAQADASRRAQLRIDLFEDNNELLEELIRRVPHVMELFLKYKDLSALVTEWLEDKFEAYRPSVSLMTPTPIESARIFKARGIELPPMPSRSHIRLNFYTNAEDGKYYASRNIQPKVPDAWMDVPVDVDTGVDLTVARKAWGLESLAVITKSRSVFNPSNEDRLSVLAAYNLSDNFKQPLRVFEPTASPSTLRIRRIRNATLPAFVFITTLLPLLAGFPVRDTTPIKALISEDYERKYTTIGHTTRSIRQWLVHTLPIVLFTLFVWLTSLGVQLVRWIVSTVDATFGLETRLSENVTYAVVFALAWFVVAEVVANSQSRRD